MAEKEKKSPADTPVMRQYKDAKAKYPDAALFFRLGDFYELFFEDAVTVARALDLTLTARNKGAAEEIPMCGVPYHAASQYIQRLLDQGFKVAICEQMADPATVKGIVPREVVRVVTPRGERVAHCGDWIVLSDQDDEWLPGRLAALSEVPDAAQVVMSGQSQITTSPKGFCTSETRRTW